MMDDYESFVDFLVAAKKSTYALQGDDASVQPLLNGSKQLEYSRGDYLYRDIYFGSAFFIGQETVELKNRPIWSMVYSGGITVPHPSADFIRSTYRFLRKALLLVDKHSLYRGPSYYEENGCVFRNEYEGTANHFFGKEIICIDGQEVYELRYSGGTIHY